MLELLNNLKEYGSCEMTCDNCPICPEKGVTPDTCYLIKYLIKTGVNNIWSCIEATLLQDASRDIEGETK